MRYLFILCASLISISNVWSQTIGTYAGAGTMGFSGNGGSANNAQINFPYAVAVDAAGNAYIADNLNHRIRKISTSGIISTLAGTGLAGYSGDGAIATSADINYPVGIAVDGNGNVYFADRLNFRIRKINTSGIISTIAGIGSLGSSGDGGPATSATLGHVNGLFIDASGVIYIADGGNNKIRKIDNSGIISTIAGVGTAGFSGDGGAATSAQLNRPFGVTFDAFSNTIYFSDANNNRIRKINSAGIISTFAGTGSAGFSGDGAAATSAQLNNPAGLAVNAAGSVFICDYDNHRVRRVDPSGNISTYAGSGTAGFSGDGGPSTSAQLNFPVFLCFDATSSLFISDRSNHRIRKVTCTQPTVSVSSGAVCIGNSFTITASGANSYAYSAGPIVSPTVTTSYTIAGQNQSGCASSYALSTVTVNPLPVISVNSGTICAGDTFTINPGGATTYMYSNGPIVSPTITSSYLITGQSQAGCVGLPVVSTVTVNQGPVLSINSSNTLICEGETITLTANGALTYTFNPGGTGASISVSPNTTTIYTVTGTDINNCKTSVSFTQNVNECVGINPEAVIQTLVMNVYPNPGHDSFYIELDGDAPMTMINALGVTILSSELRRGKNKIEMDEFPKGIYFVKVVVNETQKCIKLIKD